jgi:hypothetical protein
VACGVWRVAAMKAEISIVCTAYVICDQLDSTFAATRERMKKEGRYEIRVVSSGIKKIASSFLFCCCLKVEGTAVTAHCCTRLGKVG